MLVRHLRRGGFTLMEIHGDSWMDVEHASQSLEDVWHWFAHLLAYVEQNNAYELAMRDFQSSGYNEPTWNVPPSSTPAGVVEHYNGHDYITEQSISTGGAGYHPHGIPLPHPQGVKTL
jgi:hypothetical protein